MAAVTPDIAAARRLVVKIGSALLVDPAGGLRRDWLAALAEDVAQAKARGTDVILVSSGSIALGRGVLGLPKGALSLDQSQAAASVRRAMSPRRLGPAARARRCATRALRSYIPMAR